MLHQNPNCQSFIYGDDLQHVWHSNGPLYSNTVIGTLSVDVWAVTFSTARGGDWADCGPNQSRPHSGQRI